MRAVSALGFLLAVACVGYSPTAGAVTKKECVEAHVDAQRMRKEAQLTAAKERLLTCVNDACNQAIRKDCLQWLDDVTASIPTIVVVALDAEGKETLEVAVYVDGELFVDQLAATALEVDPGEHEFRFEMAGADPIERAITVREGERNKKIEISFAPDAPPVSEETSMDDPIEDSGQVAIDSKRGAPIIPYVLGGVGVVALGGAGFFWLSSQSKVGDLEDSGCEPRCDQADVDSVKQKRLIGDVLLGVGVVSIGVAGYLYVKHQDSKTEAVARPMVDVHPLPGGGYATVRGRF